MRKELAFAIIFGLVFGAILSLGIWKTNTALKKRNSNESSSETQLKNKNFSPETFQTLSLTLSQPEDLDVVTNSPVYIIGLTHADTYVIISTDEEDYIIQSDSKGEFKQDVNLTGGLNQITISAVDNEGNLNEKTISIIYSTEFEKNIKEQNL